MFPSVLVWVRQQGAWKLHPYNSIAQNCLLLPFWLKLNKILRTMQLLLTHNLLTYFAFTVTSLKIHTLYLYSPAPIQHTKGHFSSLDRFLTTTGTHTNYYQALTHHTMHNTAYFRITLRLNKILLMLWHGPCAFMDFFLFPLHIPTMLSYIPYSSTLQHIQ